MAADVADPAVAEFDQVRHQFAHRLVLVHGHADAAFAALSDPTRRDLVARLAIGDATVGELAAPYDMTIQAISKHLNVLAAAGLDTKRPQAQRRLVHLEADALRRLTDWVEHYARLVREKSIARGLIRATTDLQRAAYDAEGRGDELLELAEHTIFELSRTKDMGTASSVRSTAGRAFSASASRNKISPPGARNKKSRLFSYLIKPICRKYRAIFWNERKKNSVQWPPWRSAPRNEKESAS